MKTFMAYVRSMLSKKAFLNVFAEEIDPTTNNGNPEGGGQTDPNLTNTPPSADPKPKGTVNFEDLVKKARDEEKGKLYPQIEKLKEKSNSLLLVIQERDNELATANKELDKYKKEVGDLSKSLEDGTQTNKTVSDLTTQVSLLERQLDDLQVQYETDVNSLKLDSFKEKKIAEANGEIIPELVNGNTEEEIIASFESAKTKYAEITQKALANVQMPTANPSSVQIQLGKELSIEQIASKTTQEWGEVRKQLGLK